LIHRVFATAGIVVLFGCQVPAEETPSAQVDRVEVNPNSDARAIEIARTVVERMGGRDAYEATRYVSWNFFGRRRHYWDRASGDLRLEFPTEEDRYVVLMNVNSNRGEAWKNGDPVEDAAEVDRLMKRSHEIWINDAYWMFMPYKLLDPGVTLKYGGRRETDEGRPAEVLELTFAEGVGYTPQNRYEVLVATESGLVEQWDFFADAADEEPRFRLPWARWQWFGGIMLATDHGQGADWDIAVHVELPRTVFESPAPVGTAD